MGSRSRTWRAQVRYQAQTGQLIGEFRRVSRAQTSMLGQVRDQLRRATTGWRDMRLSIIAVNQSLELAGRLWRGVAGPMAAMARASLDQAEGVRRLSEALGGHGIALSDVRDQVESLTAEQQRFTRFGDDVTRAVMARLATATRGLALEYEDLARGTQALQDAQEATGQGAETLTRLVAQAAGGQATALARVMPAYRDQLRAIGDIEDGAERYRETLRILEEAYGGQARAIDSLTLDLARLDNGLGDVREAMGDLITNALRSSGVIGDLATEVDGMAASIADADSATGRFVREALSGIISFGTGAIQAVLRVAQGFRVLGGVIDLTAGAAVRVLLWAERQLDRAARGQALREIESEIDRVQARLARLPEHVDIATASVPAAVRNALARERIELERELAHWEGNVERILSGAADRESEIAAMQSAVAGEMDAQIDRIVQQADAFEGLISQVGDMSRRIRAGLAESFDPEDTDRPSGLPSIDDAGAEAAAITAAQAEESQKEWNKHWESLQALWDAEQAELAAKEEAHQEHILEIVREAEGEKRRLMRETAEAEERQRAAIEHLWMSSLDTVRGGLLRLVGDSEASWQQITGAMASAFGSTLARIGTAMAAGGAIGGPLGWPLIAAGLGFRLAASLLGRGSGGGASSASRATVGDDRPMPRLDSAPQAQSQMTTVHVTLSGGGDVYTQDATDREIENRLRRMARRGQLREILGGAR